MTEQLKKAFDEVAITYKDVIVIANDITDRYFKEIDEIIKSLYDSVESLTDEDIRQSILKISLKAYTIGEVKERASFKAELSETIKKVAYSEKYNLSEGTVAARENASIIGTSDTIIASAIYEYVACTFKTKLDEMHRCVDSLKSILISRQAEAKNLRQLDGVGDIQ